MRGTGDCLQELILHCDFCSGFYNKDIVGGFDPIVFVRDSKVLWESYRKCHCLFELSALISYTLSISQYEVTCAPQRR